MKPPGHSQHSTLTQSHNPFLFAHRPVLIQLHTLMLCMYGLATARLVLRYSVIVLKALLSPLAMLIIS